MTNLALLASSMSMMTVEGRFGSGPTLFAFTAPAAGLCLVTSIVVAVIADREDNAELGVFAGFFIVISALPMAQSLLTPGLLYGPNPASSFTAAVVLPAAVAAGLPLVAPRSRVARVVGQRWRAWVGSWIGLVGAVALIALAVPQRLPAIDSNAPWVVAVTLSSGLVILTMGFGHLRLYWLSRAPASLVAAIGFVVLAHSAVGRGLVEPLEPAFWWSHVLDVTGVGLATIMAIIGYRQSSDLRRTIRPIVSTEPMLALEIGLDPTVHDFVALLERKDPITRDHVTRVAELATRVGLRLGLRPDDLRDLAIGSVLHDIGKLEIPDAILNKPGRLDPEEYEVIKTHTVIGGDLIARSPALASAEAIVRGHHERPDGRGYPDGLTGEEIPLAARVVAACDAFDAIANTRQYRDGRGPGVALGVLQEHAGTQFDPDVVDVVARVVETAALGDGFSDVGRDQLHRTDESVCPDCERSLTASSTSGITAQRGISPSAARRRR